LLAADKRVTSGNLISAKKVDKILFVSEYIAATRAGTASDAQLLIRYAQSELRLKRIRTGKEATVKEAANLMSRMVYANIRRMSMIPGISHFIMGGVDDKGFHLYDVYADGTITLCEDYMSSGSGSVMAYGVLDTLYKKDMSTDEGIQLVVKAINAALQRDVASGNGIDVVSITKDGAKKIIEKELTYKITV
jgi:proteasome beta subunit